MTTSWMHHAACRGRPAVYWYPEENDPTNRAIGLNICWNECTVRTQCLQHALTNREYQGTWGGYTTHTRRRNATQ